MVIPQQTILLDTLFQRIMVNIAEMKRYDYSPEEDTFEVLPVGIGQAGLYPLV